MEEHLINDLGMEPLIGDRALNVKRDGGGNVKDICGAYVDDFLSAVSKGL